MREGGKRALEIDRSNGCPSTPLTGRLEDFLHTGSDFWTNAITREEGNGLRAARKATNAEAGGTRQGLGKSAAQHVDSMDWVLMMREMGKKGGPPHKVGRTNPSPRFSYTVNIIYFP